MRSNSRSSFDWIHDGQAIRKCLIEWHQVPSPDADIAVDNNIPSLNLTSSKTSADPGLHPAGKLCDSFALYKTTLIVGTQRGKTRCYDERYSPWG